MTPRRARSAPSSAAPASRSPSCAIRWARTAASTSSASDGTRRNYFDARGAGAVGVDLGGLPARPCAAPALLHCHLDDWCRRAAAHGAPERACASAATSRMRRRPTTPTGPTSWPPRTSSSSRRSTSPTRPGSALGPGFPASGPVVVVGAGDKGCLIARDGHVKHYPAADLPEWPVVDTNGAGDTLAATFLASYLVEELDAWRDRCDEPSSRHAGSAASAATRRYPSPAHELEALEAASTGRPDDAIRRARRAGRMVAVRPRCDERSLERHRGRRRAVPARYRGETRHRRPSRSGA